MTFTKNEIKRIKQALYLAIDYEESSIDAHTTELKMCLDGIVRRMVVPKGSRGYVRIFQGNIKAFNRILEKIKKGGL